MLLIFRQSIPDDLMFVVTLIICYLFRLNAEIKIDEKENGCVRRKLVDVIKAMQPTVKKGPGDTVRLKISGTSLVISHAHCKGIYIDISFRNEFSRGNLFWRQC